MRTGALQRPSSVQYSTVSPPPFYMGWAPSPAQPKRDAPTVITGQGDPPPVPYPLFRFQEESKEEQTAMVPQAIPLRRCRYCLVLVGDVHILLWETSGPD